MNALWIVFKFNRINTTKLTQVGSFKIIVIRAPTMIILKSLRFFEIQDKLFQRLITILRALSGINVQFSHSP